MIPKVPQPQAAITPTPAPSDPRRNRWVIYWVIILLAFLVGGAAVAFLYELNRGNSLTSTARPTETPTPVPATKSSKLITDKSSSASPLAINKQAEPKTSGDQNLSGEWDMVNTVEKTSYPPYANLQMGYRLMINQVGTEFTAEGEKLSENGNSLPTKDRTPIHVTGSINGETVGATFVEEGKRRKTSGRFAWKIEAQGNRLVGTFASTAASSSGTSVATKEK